MDSAWDEMKVLSARISYRVSNQIETGDTFLYGFLDLGAKSFTIAIYFVLLCKSRIKGPSSNGNWALILATKVLLISSIFWYLSNIRNLFQKHNISCLIIKKYYANLLLLYIWLDIPMKKNRYYPNLQKNRT